MDAADTPRMRVFSLVHRLDLRVLLWSMTHREHPRYFRTARLVSRTGDGYLQVATPVVAWFSGADLARPFAIHLCTVFAIERVVYWLLKNGLRRPRPYDSVPSLPSLIRASDRFSCPSGHTSASFLFAAVVLQIDLIAGVALMAWAGTVGVSRVALGVHYPTDVLAGALLGLAVSELFLFG